MMTNIVASLGANSAIFTVPGRKSNEGNMLILTNGLRPTYSEDDMVVGVNFEGFMLKDGTVQTMGHVGFNLTENVFPPTSDSYSVSIGYPGKHATVVLLYNPKNGYYHLNTVGELPPEVEKVVFSIERRSAANPLDKAKIDIVTHILAAKQSLHLVHDLMERFPQLANASIDPEMAVVQALADQLREQTEPPEVIAGVEVQLLPNTSGNLLILTKDMDAAFGPDDLISKISFVGFELKNGEKTKASCVSLLINNDQVIPGSEAVVLTIFKKPHGAGIDITYNAKTGVYNTVNKGVPLDQVKSIIIKVERKVRSPSEQ